MNGAATMTNANEEVIRRNLNKLRREMGPAIRKAIDDPEVVEVMLNPDGRVWTDKLGIGMYIFGSRFTYRGCRHLRVLCPYYQPAGI